GVDLELVVQHPDQPDQGGPGEQCPRLVGLLEELVEVGEVIGDQQTGAQPEEHRDPAEARSGFPVHVPCPDLRHRPGHDRELAYRPGQQVRHRGRDTERQQVFTHGLPHRSRWPSQPHTLARRAYGWGLPGSDDGCTYGCASRAPTRRPGPQCGYGGKAAASSRTSSRARAGSVPPRSTLASSPATRDISRVPMPWVVTAAVPRRSPRSSACGIAQQSSTRPAAASRPRASRPPTPSGAGSTVIRWVSVPPVVTTRPSAARAAASARALATTWCAYTV